MLQDQVAVLLEMLAVAHDPPLAGEQLRQRLLAQHQRRRTQVVTVEIHRIMTIMEDRATNHIWVATDERSTRRAPLRNWVLGPPQAPRWERPGLLALLVGTAVLYLWRLGSLGWANEFYAAAVQAGTQSWKALLFGSLDAGNAITVDKPPAAMWVMGLSGRLFGFNSWSMLAPQALMGVAAVALLYAAVRRTSGPGAGLLAGSALALTPVAALMFRFNNPDALLVLLLVAAGYCVVRALQSAHSTRWIALSGTAIGFAFLAKLLQAFLVLPALGLVVLVAMPGSIWKRLRDLLVGLVAMVFSAGWFVALVSLWPADSRPYIGGSTDNSLLELALGYNGLGRVLGGDGNPTNGSGGPRRWRWPRRFDVRRQCRHHPDVRRVDGHRDLLAAAGRAHRPDRRTVVHPACTAHQPHPGGPAAVGWLDGGDGRGVQLYEGHHAPLLHDRPGSRSCRRGRHRGG